MWSQPTLPASVATTLHDGIDPYHDPDGSPTALGIANNTNNANAASDGNGANG